MRLELTFPAKGHYNESQDISNLHSVLDHPIVFLSQITDKNQNPHFRNIKKRFRLYFQCIISNAQTEKFEKYYVEADRTIRPVC